MSQTDDAPHNGGRIVQQFDPIAGGWSAGNRAAIWPQGGGQEIGNQIDADHNIALRSRWTDNLWFIHKLDCVNFGNKLDVLQIDDLYAIRLAKESVANLVYTNFIRKPNRFIGTINMVVPTLSTPLVPSTG